MFSSYFPTFTAVINSNNNCRFMFIKNQDPTWMGCNAL